MRGEEKSEWLSGHHSVLEALKAGRRKIFKVCLGRNSNRSQAAEIRQWAKERKVSCEEVGNAEFQRLGMGGAKGDHQAWVAAKTSAFPYDSLEDLVHIQENPGIFFACDQIQDVHNLGALLRSHYALGGKGVILCRRESAQVTPAVSRVSAGAVEHLRIFLVNNLASCLKQLKENGFWVIAAAAGGSGDLLELPSPPGVVVVGSEAKGIRASVLAMADRIVRIPMVEGYDSLNVSVSSALILYEFVRQGKLSLTP